MTTNEAAGSSANPYVGPVPFHEGQKLYGRERETNELVDLVVSKRIVLLIAPSGAGKTSLIQSALIPRLRDRYKLLALPTIRLTYRSREIEARQGVNRYALSTMRSLEAHFLPEHRYTDEELVELSLGEYFARRFPCCHDDGSRLHWLIVLDQFEELFTLDPLDVDQKRAFLEDLGNVLAGILPDSESFGSAAAPTFWALVSMREDYVAELQPFLELIPTGLAFRYRLDLLERARALEPVAMPAGSSMDPSTAPRLVESLLTIHLRDPEGKEVTREGRFVEPVQLQVVCRLLWDKIVSGEKRSIHPDDVDQADVEEALSEYINASIERAAQAAQMSQKVLRDWLEDHLVTSTGIRAQALREPLVLGKLDDAIASLVEARLVLSDKRNDREWIELAHDRLVGPLRAANKKWRCRNLKPFQRQAELYASTGQVHREMLFWGDELLEAERFAAAHPDEINDDERRFLRESREERDRIFREKRRGRLLMAAGIATLVVIVALTLRNYQLLDERNEKLIADAQKVADDARRTQLRREISATREAGRPIVESVRDLLKVHDEITFPPTNTLWRFFDNTLRETLQKIPRSLESKLGSRGDVVRSLAFAAGGNQLIVGSWDGTTSVWRVDRPGPAVFASEYQGAETYAAAYHEASGLLASTYLDGRIILWRMTEGGLERLTVLNADNTAYRKQVTTAGFNRSGTLLATAGWDKQILLWDVSNPNQPTATAAFGSRYHLAPIQRIVFLPPEPRGQRIASIDLDGRVAIWRVPDTASQTVGEVRPERTFAVSELLQRDVGLYSAAASPDGRYLVTGDSEGHVHVWDLRSNGPPASRGIRLTQSRHGQDNALTQIFDIAFSPDGREFASVGVDGLLLRWTLPDGAKDVVDLAKRISVERVRGWGERLYSVAYHPSRRGVVAVGGKRAVELVNMDQRGTLLASPLASSDETVDRWHAVSMNSTGTTIAAARGDNIILFWRRQPEGVVPVPMWKINAGKGARFALHPDGSSLVTASCAGEVTRWQLEEGKPPASAVVARGDALASTCPSAAPVFARDGKLLAVASGRLLRLWMSDRGAWEQRFNGTLDDDLGDEPGGPLPRRDRIISVAVSAASDLVAAGGESGRIRFLDIRNGQPAGGFRSTSVDAGSAAVSLAILPDGSGLLSGGKDGVISEWSLPSLKKTTSSERHQREVSSLAFADRAKDPSGGRPSLVSADLGGAIFEWSQGTLDGPTTPIAFADDRPLDGMALRADGTFLVTAGDQLLAWDFSRTVMKQSAERFLRTHSH